MEEQEQKTAEKKSFIQKIRVFQRNHYFSYNANLLFTVFLIIIFTHLATRFLCNAFSKRTPYQVSYTEKGTLDYQVYLKENSYFDEPYLGKDLQYIASLIDYIKAEFDYTFESDKNLDYEYTYSIIGIVEAKNVDDNRTLLTKEYTLLEQKKVEASNTNQYHIFETLDIDYEVYNSIMNQFKSDYALQLNGNLIVKLVVQTSGKYQSFNPMIDDVSSMEIVIPLSEQTLNITMQTRETEESNFARQESTFELVNVVFLVLGLLFVISDAVVLARYFYLIGYGTEKTSKYQKKLRKILREYDRIIINSKNLPVFSNYENVKITTFEELVDVSERISKPILFKEIHKGEKSIFLVVDKRIVYQYVLKKVDVD